MLLLLSLALILSLAAIGLGFGFFKLLKKLINQSEEYTFSYSEAFFIGLVLIGLYGTVVWMFLPLNSYTAWPLLIPAIYHLIKQELFNRIGLIVKGLGIIILAITGALLLAKAATVSTYYDSGLYYIQTMRWMEQYAIVPGLGNLHIRLAMASPWHMIAALFSGYPILTGSYDYLNELTYFWFLVFVIQHIFTADKRAEKIIFLLLLPVLSYLNSMLSSTSPDFPNAIYTWLILFWLYTANKNSQRLKIVPLIYAALSIAFLIVSKASALYLAPVFLFLIYHIIQLNYKAGILSFVLTLFFIAIGCVKTWILSGYFYYLIPGTNFIQVDWMVKDSVVQWYNKGVTDFARFKGNFIHALSHGKHLGWIKIWHNNLSWVDRLIVWIQIPAIIITGYLINLLWKSKKTTFQLAAVFYLSAIVGTLIWFIKAPDIRFHWAILSAMPLIGLAFNLTKVSFSKLSIYTYLILWLLANSYLLMDVRPWKHYLLKPAPYPNVNTSQYLINNNTTIYYPMPDANTLQNKDQCWDAPLPCTYQKIMDIELRGLNIQDGFRVKKAAQQ